MGVLTHPSINDSDTVAYYAMKTIPLAMTGIYLQTIGNPPVTYVDQNDGITVNQ